MAADFWNLFSEDSAISESRGYGHKLECCPLVVDPIAFFSLLAGLAASTFFLNQLITMNIMMVVVKRSLKGKQMSFWDRLLDIAHKGNYLIMYGN